MGRESWAVLSARYHKHQPDLNIVHPAVREEIARIAGFWLQLGLSGFASMPYRSSSKPWHPSGPDLDPHKFLRDLLAFLGRRCGDAILLGEVNLEPRAQRRFFGDEDGDELHMCLNFNINQAMALALVREEAAPLVEPCARSPRSRRTHSGATSCGTMTSGPSTSFRTRSARRCSLPSGRKLT